MQALEIYRQRYHELRQRVQSLQQAVTGGEVASLKGLVTDLQAWCRQELFSLAPADLDPVLVQRMQSYHVEIDRQLRLLELDGLFLQAARQSATAQQRQQQVHSRLQTLLGYCDVLLATE